MKATGIIIEYNPMHYGHKHHLQQTKLLSGADLVIGVMSPNFVQRGEPAIVSKFKRTQAALEQGVDIICELPTIDTLQSAQFFANKAVEILNLMNVDSLVFGSESNDLKSLQELSELPINLEKLKTRLSLGQSYASAMDRDLNPNDILGVAYLKALKNTNIKPISIKRTNTYYTNQETEFVSAYEIRNNLENKHYTSQSLVDLSEIVDYSIFFELLRYQLLSSSSEELEQIFLITEGIQNLFKEKIVSSNSFSEFLDACTSRRYSTSRIKRLCTHIVLKTKHLPIDNYKVRILGAREHALPYLKDLPVGTKISDFQENQIQPEIKATQIYQLMSKEKNLHHQEISKLIILPTDQYSLE